MHVGCSDTVHNHSIPTWPTLTASGDFHSRPLPPRTSGGGPQYFLTTGLTLCLLLGHVLHLRVHPCLILLLELDSAERIREPQYGAGSTSLTTGVE